MTIQLTPHVEVTCVCDGGWRICDERIEAGDSRRLISYVERVEDDFEVLWLPTLSVEHMSSLEDAVAAARAYCADRDGGAAARVGEGDESN